METPYRSSRIADLSAEDRPREKALAIGVEALTTTELVALLLGSGTPGESVINLSQRILADSGNSLQELSRRTIRNLVRSFKGVGDAKAVTLLAAIELGKRYAQEGPVEKPVINMPSKAYDLMLDKLTGLDHEEFWAIYLNTAKRVITRARISQGGVAATVVDVKIERLTLGGFVTKCHDGCRYGDERQDDVCPPQRVGHTCLEVGKIARLEI